ncbi:DJ-1/PfpI family protein [Vibrio sp. PP-XX7]
MHQFLIIVPEGGMLFEAVGIADILKRANLLQSENLPPQFMAEPLYQPDVNQQKNRQQKVSQQAADPQGVNQEQDTHKQGYQITIASTQSHRVVHGQPGLHLLADNCLLDLDPDLKRDTVMITGKGLNEEEGSRIVDWIRRAAPNAQRIVSVCSGALLLAQAGLLDGRRATTHWRSLDTLQSEFPKVKLNAGRSIFRMGRFGLPLASLLALI